VVVRFSEMQAKLAPESCCREIAEIIWDLTGDQFYLNSVKNQVRLFRHEKWTYQEAIDLSKKQIRKDYSKLNLSFISLKPKQLIGNWTGPNIIKICGIEKSPFEYFHKNETLEISDTGKLRFIESADGRLGILAKESGPKVVFIIETAKENSLVLTEVNSRFSYKFVRTEKKS
jgi:hypothetical protein